MLRAWLRDSAVLATGALFGRGLAFLLLPIYTRILSPGDFGILDLLGTLAAFAGIVVPLEISQALARSLADERDPTARRDIGATALWFTLGAYLLLAAILLPLAPSVAGWMLGSRDLASVFRIGVVYLVLSGVLYLLQNQFRWELRSMDYAISSAFAAGASAAASLTFAWGFGFGLSGFLVGMCVGTGLAIAHAGWRLRASFRARMDRRQLVAMLRFSIPLVPAGVAVFVNGFIDRIMIGRLLEVSDVGLYGLGFRLATIASVLSFGFQMAVTPLVYARHADPATPAALARIFRLYVGSSLLLVCVLAAGAPEWVALLAPPTFAPAVSVVAPLAATAVLAPMYVFFPGASLARRTSIVMVIQCVGALLNIALNLLLIPRLGISGAALATLISQSLVLATGAMISQRWYPVPHAWGRLAIAASVVVMACGASVSWRTQPLERLPVGVSLLACSTLAVLLSGTIRVQELIAAIRGLAAVVARRPIPPA